MHRVGYLPASSPAVAEIAGASREWTVAMISELSMPWQLDRGDAEVCMLEMRVIWQLSQGLRDGPGWW